MNIKKIIQEATFHDPSTLHFIRYDRLTEGGYTPPRFKEHRKQYNEKLDAHDEDVEKQSDHLLAKQYPEYKKHDAVTKHLPLSYYTNSGVSRALNAQLIKNSNMQYSKHEWLTNYVPTMDGYNSEEKLTHKAEELSQHIKTHAVPLEHETHVYSGTRINMHEISKQSDVVHLPAFTSTSLSIHTAQGFGSHEIKPSYEGTNKIEQHMIHFKLPAGYKGGMFVAPVSNFGSEQEYLLDKGQTWKITGHKRVNKVQFGGSKTQPRKRINHIHIWTLEPHHVVNEMTYHDPDVFRKFSDYSQKGPKSSKIHTLQKHLDKKIGDAQNDWQNQHARMVKHFTANHLEEHHKTAIYEYTTNADEGHVPRGNSKHLNEELIRSAYTASTKPYSEGVHMMDMAIHALRKPLDEEVHTYAGIRGWNPSKLMNHEGVFHTPAYTSTSIDPKTALGFTDLYDTDIKDMHILHFHLPKGYDKGAYIDHLSDCSGERELLLHRGQSWKVVKHDTRNMVHYNTKYSESFNEKGEPNANYGAIGKQKRVRKVHIWTVVPHEHVNESTYHDPHIFREWTDLSSSKGKAPGDNKLNASVAKRLTDMSIDAHDQHARLKQAHPVPHHHREVISSYTSDSEGINSALIDSDWHPAAEKIDDALHECSKPLEEDVHVYSGLKNWHPGEVMNEGKIFRTPAFTSTSISPHIALGFTEGLNEQHVIHFHLPKGSSHGTYINHVSDYPGEKEFLLKRNQQWKVTGHKVVNRVSINKKYKYNYDLGKPEHIGKEKNVLKIHIWSVVPHDPKKSVSESTYHNPDVFRQATYDVTFAKLPGPHLDEYREQIENLKVALYQDVLKQHQRLVQHQGYFEDHHHKALREYTRSNASGYDSSSWVVNHHLLGKQIGDRTPEVVQPHVEKLDAAIAHHAKPLEEDVHVYSGLKSLDPGKMLKEHGKFHTPAFMSTSIDPDQAIDFAATRTDPDSPKLQEERHVLHFHLPKGYDRGVYVDHISHHEGEKEYILHRGQTWKLTGHKTVNQIHYNKNTTDNGKRLVKVHVWSVEPHDADEFRAKHVNEAYDHPASDATMTNVKNNTPAKRQLRPEYIEEHDHLSHLHDHVTKQFSSTVHRITTVSHMINANLLEGSPVHPMWSGVHKKLGEMFEKTPALKREHHVYSGMGDFDPRVHFAHTHGVFRTPCYISTSISPEVAVAHTNLKGFEAKEEHVLHFKLPAGFTGGHYIANHSPFPGEHEMLLKPDQKWKLVSHSKYQIQKKSGWAVRHVWSVEPHD